jgi:hypothetical protein
MRIFLMLVHEVRVGTCQTYSQSHKLEVTKVTWQSGGDRNDLALSSSHFSPFMQKFILFTYVARPKAKLI